MKVVLAFGKFQKELMHFGIAPAHFGDWRFGMNEVENQNDIYITQ